MFLLELPVASPLVHGTLRTLTKWQDILRDDIDSKIIPTDYIPGIYVDSEAKGPAIHKYRTLLEKSNTPFNSQGSSAPARRLWNFLVRQEQVQDIFIRAIFGKRKSMSTTEETVNIISPSNSVVDGGISATAGGEGIANTQAANVSDPVRIIHKDQESISAFCTNSTNPGLLALATPRELQEVDVSLLLTTPHWFEDECELDIMNLNRDSEQVPASSFLVVQAPSDKY